MASVVAHRYYFVVTGRCVYGMVLLCLVPWCYVVKTSVSMRISTQHLEMLMIRPLLSSTATNETSTSETKINVTIVQQEEETEVDSVKFDRTAIPHPFTEDTAAGRTAGDTFAPGSLNMTLWETFHRCNVDTVSRRYRKHESACSVMAYSGSYGLAYHLLGKSASSTIRLLLRNHLKGQEGKVCSKGNDASDLKRERYEHWIHFTFFRNPLPRFISGYTEFMTRFLHGKGEKPRRRYRGFLDTVNHHLQNISLYHAENTTRGKPRKLQKPDLYKQLYETNEGMQVLARVFDEFVRDYDAAEPFDKHLMLQVPRKILSITSQTGTFLPLDFVFYMEGGLEQQIQDVLFSQIRHFDSTIWLPNITGFRKGNSRTRKTKSMLDYISKETKQKICQLTALDYCCLNYALPDECQDLVSCRWTDQVMDGSLPAREGVLSIEAVSSYP